MLQAQKSARQEGDPLLGDHAQQPTDVVTGSTLHRMQTVALRTLQVTTNQAVVCRQVSIDGLNGLAPPELLFLLLADPLGFAPVHDVHTRVVRVHASVAQINECRCELCFAVLHQDRGLLHWLGQGVPVIRIPMECPSAHDQVALECAGDTHLDPEFPGCFGLAFVHLRGISGIELGLFIDTLALAALGIDALGLVQDLSERLAHGRPDRAGLGGCAAEGIEAKHAKTGSRVVIPISPG